MTKDTPPTEKYLTPLEIAAELRISRMTVHRMIKSGKLPAIQVGTRTYRIPVEGYAAYKADLGSVVEEEAPAAGPGQLDLLDTEDTD